MPSFALPDNWLRDKLQQHGVSQKQLGDELGIDAPGTSRLISGRRKLQFDELPKLIRLLSDDSTVWRLDSRLSMSEQSRGRLESALKVTGMDPVTFSALSGVPEAAVTAALEKGGAVTDTSLADAAAKLLGISQAYLQMSGGPKNTPDTLYRLSKRWRGDAHKEQDNYHPPEMKSYEDNRNNVIQPGPIPIYAAAIPMGNGQYQWPDIVAEQLDMPLLATVQGAWGMFVGEGGAPPRFAQGDILYIHPHRPVRPGDFAVARNAGKLTMGTVISANGRSALIDENGESIPELEGARLEKVVAATFD